MIKGYHLLFVRPLRGCPKCRASDGVHLISNDERVKFICPNGHKFGAWSVGIGRASKRWNEGIMDFLEKKRAKEQKPVIKPKRKTLTLNKR